MAPEGIGHEVLEDLLHREEQRLIHVLTGESRQTVMEQEQTHPSHHSVVVAH